MDVEVHKIGQLRADSQRIIAEAERVTAQNQEREKQLLSAYVKYHRKYKDGYEFPYDGDICTLGRAYAYFDDKESTIYIAYCVSRNGFEIDSILEKNVNHPDYV